MLEVICPEPSSRRAGQQYEQAIPASRGWDVRRPCHIDRALVARVLGRCGHVTDTPDPQRYATLFNRLWSKYGSRFRYGFMVPVNLLLEGALRHPTYHEKRVPQMASLVILKRQQQVWAAVTVLWVRQEPQDSDELAMEQKLISFYGDFGVEMLVLRPDQIDQGIFRPVCSSAI